jgi:hypothetical protein
MDAGLNVKGVNGSMLAKGRKKEVDRVDRLIELIKEGNRKTA